MKKVLTGMMSLLAVSVTAQEKGTTIKNMPKEPMAIIDAKIDHLPNDSIVYIMDPYTRDFDSTYVKNHSFRLKVPVGKGGCVYILQVGNNPTETNGMGRLVFLEEGKLNIRGKGNSFNGAAFTGSKFVEEWEEIMDMTDPQKGDGLRYAELEKQYIEANRIGDEEVMEKLNEEGNKIVQKRNAELLKWISNHPNSPVCGYILSVYFEKNRPLIDSVYNTLGDQAKNALVMRRFMFPGKYDPRPVDIKPVDGEVADAMQRVKIGTIAPDFSVPDLNGKNVSLSDFRGKYVLIDFWASWCVPCVALIPHLKEIEKEFSGDKFMIFAVSLDTKREGWEKAIKKHDLTWVNVSNIQGWGDPVAKEFGVTSLPFNVLIDPEGKVVGYNLGGEHLKAKLTELLKK